MKFSFLISTAAVTIFIPVFYLFYIFNPEPLLDRYQFSQIIFDEGSVRNPKGNFNGYIVKDKDGEFVVINDIPGKKYDYIPRYPNKFGGGDKKISPFLRRSSDDKHIVYYGVQYEQSKEEKGSLSTRNIKSIKLYLIKDGVESGPVNIDSETMTRQALSGVFSSDGSRYAFYVPIALVVDGVEGKQYSSIGGEISHPAIFSPDNTKVAYIGCSLDYSDSGCNTVINEAEGPNFDDIYDLQFSDDSKHFAYVGFKNGTDHIVVDNEIIFSAPAISYHVYYDDQMRPLVYGAADKRVAFYYQDKRIDYLVVNGKKKANYNSIDSIGVSPRNGRVAYSIKRDSGEYVVIDDQERGPFKFVQYLGTIFSPDGLHYAFAVIDASNNYRLITDSHEYNLSDFDLKEQPDSLGNVFLRYQSNALLIRFKKNNNDFIYSINNGSITKLDGPCEMYFDYC